MWTRAVLVVVGMSAVAHANPAAEKLFQDGKGLLAQGKTAEACDAFRRSQELEARVGTLLNLADCEEQRGRLATAWVAFVDARALATRMSDARAAFAEQRAAALAARLPYLTIKVGAGAPEGLVVRRNGTDVPRAELDLEAPLDPGRYELAVSAPGFVTWTQAIELAVGQRAVIDVPALVADPSSPAPTPTLTGALPAPAQGVRSHRIGLGAAIGYSTDGDLIYGGRIPLHLASVGAGTIRVVPSVFLAELEDPSDIYHGLELYAVGVGVEYVAPLAPRFVLAAGLGAGIDLIDDSYLEDLVTNGWGAVRLSPTLRLPYSVDVGLHLQVVATADAIVGLGTLGVDYFFW